jgi:alginate O-acetyltransferase complex protein AlgI
MPVLMLFNSFAFAVFLPTVFLLYWLIPREWIRAQNFLLLVVSYVFYGWWDWRFLTLLFISSLVDFLAGLGMLRTTDPTRRKVLLGLSLLGNLGLLGFFKYFNFFVDSFVTLLQGLGLEAHRGTLSVLLPVGISFYTFQALSYTIDVYRGHLRPRTDPIAFLAFISFFPQLVAGPIERAASLLPQFERPRTFDWHQASDGMRQILWGLFKKVVIADNLGRYVDRIYSSYSDLSGIDLALGTVYFAFQIYCDFSGYSDIAIGTGRLFGFTLTRNFAYPYFSRNIAEFWRRWHISLSTWFRDYVYVPLGGNRTTRARLIRNVLLTFTISGLWHGASWNFIVWGALHGLYYVPLALAGKQRPHADVVAAGRILPTARETLQMLLTFVLVLFAWIFFRAPSLGEAISFIAHMGTHAWLVYPQFEGGIVYVAGLVVIEWLQRGKQHALEVPRAPVALRWAVYYAAIAGMFWFGYTQHRPFIYFQF